MWMNSMCIIMSMSVSEETKRHYVLSLQGRLKRSCFVISYLNQSNKQIGDLRTSFITLNNEWRKKWSSQELKWKGLSILLLSTERILSLSWIIWEPSSRACTYIKRDTDYIREIKIRLSKGSNELWAQNANKVGVLICKF